MSGFSHFIRYFTHISVGEVGLSSFIDCLQSLQVVVQLVFDIGFDQVKLRHCAGMFQCFFDIIIGLSESLVSLGVVLCKQIESP